MANRVTYEDVQEIFSTTMEPDQITACIIAANTLVNNTCAQASPALDAVTLKEIERWLSAHFCCLRDPVALRAVQGDSEQWSFPASVTVAWGRGLNITIYGQNAIAMDISGSLASVGKQNQAASYRAAPRENSSRYSSSD